MSLLEVCCGNIESVKAAKEAGADRIELCTALEVGGLTPSIGQIDKAVEIFGTGVFVLIRERPGDFVYSQPELDVMGKDIAAAIKAGVSGIVIGALSPFGDIDLEGLKYLIDKAENKEITFHRAFDEVKDPFKALEKIIASGCHRILTSGQREKADQALPFLKELNERANKRIIIMPGSGVSCENASKILEATGCNEIHASAKEFRNSTWMSSVEEIRKIKNSLSKI